MSTQESQKSSKIPPPFKNLLTKDIENVSSDVVTENLISLGDEKLGYEYPIHEEVKLINGELKDLTFSLQVFTILVN